MPAQGQLAQRNRRDDDTLYERYLFFEPLYDSGIAFKISMMLAQKVLGKHSKGCLHQ